MTVMSDNSGRHYIYNHCSIETLKGLSITGGLVADMVFLDPPFNIGQEYDTHNDKLPQADFEHMVNDILFYSSSILRPGGVLAVHVPDHMVELVFNCIASHRKVTPAHQQMIRKEWIIWHYRFAQHCRRRFIPSKMHCLIYVKGNKVESTFNDSEVMEPSDRASKYGDKRTLDSDTPGMRNMFDVWTDIPRLTGNSKERVSGDNPNQLPEEYLERLLLAYCNVDDLVVDAFGGTFTTATVAKRLGIKSVTCDISEAYCKAGLRRINETPGAIFSV